MSGPQRARRQRSAVADALGGTDRFRSARELHDLVRGGGRSIGLTTVSRPLQARHLRALADSGAADVLRADDGAARYRSCPTGAPAVERWARSVTRQPGHTDVTHTLEVVGTRGACSSS